MPAGDHGRYAKASIGTMIKSENPELAIPAPEAIQRIANSEDRKLAWHFFIFFSRMEYALKRSGVYLVGNDSKADPNWDKFGSTLNSKFDPKRSTKLTEAVAYFDSQPPRKQKISDDGTLGWSGPIMYKEGPRLAWLLLAIRCVRNNLFHGGKFPLIPISDPSRDRELILNSMVILNAVLPLAPEVSSIFFEAIED